MRITILFENFGPYHLARLEAASEVCELSAIEINATSCDYQWQREDRPTPFAWQTVFGNGRNQTGNIFQAARRVGGVVGETKPDVVAIPGWSGCYAFAALHWCGVNRVPAVVMSESTPDDETRVRWKEWVKRRYVGMCAAALAGGERHRDYLIQLGMPAENVFLGYDAVDNRYFSKNAKAVRQEADLWRKRLELPDRYLLASARFIEKKNLPNLLRAFAKYRDESSRGSNSSAVWDLVVLGDGELRPQLEYLRQQLGLVNIVHFTGFKQYAELPPYYALAEAFIHSSTIEQWGLVVNEAMASELPVLISNRCGCAAALVREGENGWTFDPTEIESIANCMRKLWHTSNESRLAMGRRGAQIVAEFGPKRFADGLLRAAMVSIASRAEARSTCDLLLLRALVLKNQQRLMRRASR